MKKVLLVLGMTALFCGADAQSIILQDNFESGYTDGVSISEVDEGWQYWGDGFTMPAKNVSGEGAEGDDWYARMEHGGVANFAVIQRVYELMAGETYEYKIWVKPDLSGQKGSLKLEVINTADANAVVAGPVKIAGAGMQWEELTIAYTAEATQNYAFRLTKTWGTDGASFDNVELICTTCTSTSIDSSSLSDKVKVYPNPATDIINISATDVDIAEVLLLDLTGKAVYQSASTEPISVSSLPKGLYVLKLEAANGDSSTSKVMIK